jgi:hypothetical protein
MKYFLAIALIIILASCKKETPATKNATPSATADSYIKYSIFKDAHYCDKTVIKTFTGTGMKLKVKFDSSAIYNNLDPENQYDINKLAGFTEGIDNHVNSARIGWSWNDNALRLYAYSYADAIRSSQEICTVAIGQELFVTISVTENEYVFKINDKTVSLLRTVHTASVSGYWQYPYFGGDETAPHDIFIYMEEAAN